MNEDPSSFYGGVLLDYRMKAINAHLDNCEEQINKAIGILGNEEQSEIYNLLCSAYQALSIARHYLDRMDILESPQKQPL